MYMSVVPKQYLVEDTKGEHELAVKLDGAGAGAGAKA